MSAPLAFPGGRALAGWWRQLSPYHPEAVWVAHLTLHHIEALVPLARPRRLDRFGRFVLQALRQEAGRRGPGPDDLLARLDDRLHVGRPLLRQALRALAAEGLVRPEGPGGWAVTPAGEEAVEKGEFTRPEQERRGFHFAAPRRGGDPPHYLDLNSHGGGPSPAEEGPPFDVDALRASVARPAEWKERYGFPPEVREVVGPEAPAGVPAWRPVIVARPERLLAVLAPVADEQGGRRLLGFAARQDGWALQAGEPAFVVRSSWGELFPELAAEPPAGAWR